MRIAAAHDQTVICPWTRREVSVHTETDTGRLGHIFRVVPPQPNFPPQLVPGTVRSGRRRREVATPPCVACNDRDPGAAPGDDATHRGLPDHRVSAQPTAVEVFQRRRSSLLDYALRDRVQAAAEVKLNRVFFPRCIRRAHSPDCWFAGDRTGTVVTWLIHSCASTIIRQGIALP